MIAATLRNLLSKRAVLAALSAGVVAGCVGAGGSEKRGGDPVAEERLQVAMALAAQEPALAPGDSFVFDNPMVTWTVDGLRADGGIEWSADNGERQITAANPLLPALAWQSPERGTGTRLISGLSEPMFPLVPGKTVTFRATVDTDQPPYAWEFDWVCTIGEFAPITVPAGTFESVPVSCGRQTPGELVFQYAPAVGNYVQLAVATGAGTDPIVRRLQRFKRTAMAAQPMMADKATSEDGMIESTVMMEDGRADGSSVAPLSQQQEGGENFESGPTVLGLITGVSEEPQPPAGAPVTSASGQANGSAEATAAATAAASAAASGVGPAVHLASYKNPANAEKGWRQLLAANGDQLTGTRPVIREVTIPGRGVFYRLHAGPLASEGAAKSVCQALTQRGVYCKAVTLQ